MKHNIPPPRYAICTRNYVSVAPAFVFSKDVRYMILDSNDKYVKVLYSARDKIVRLHKSTEFDTHFDFEGIDD